MTLPKSIKVGYLTIQIREVPASEAKERGVNGWWDYDKALIEIDESLEPQVKMETFLHEVLHACCTMGNVYGNDEYEECWVNGVAPQLLFFLLNNKLDWLKEAK